MTLCQALIFKLQKSIIMSSYFHKEEPSHKKEHPKLKQIPHLQSASKISQLNFSFNDIRSIPSHITSAINLQLIDLSHNRIGKIEHVFGVSSLKFINLSHNLITEVPEDMLQLVQLQNLDLGFNKITILNNIKVLKQLVEARTFKYQGFIEINLEGNDVLKKKGCRDIYQKWMNPNFEDYTRMLNKSSYEHMTSRTKKREAKSMELPVKQKEQLMQTNKTLLLNHNNTLNKSRDFINQSQNLTEKNRMSPSLAPEINNDMLVSIMPVKSEVLKSRCNLKDLSAIANEDADCSCPNQWFSSSLEKLKELNNVFTLIITNQDVKNLESDCRQRIVEQSLYAKELINISTEAITQTLESKLSKDKQQNFKEELSLICQKIRQMHKETLKIFSEKDHLPLKFYKPWVVYFRQLKQLSIAIPQKINQHQNKKQRIEQIQDLANISPEKQEDPFGKSQIQNNQSTSKNRGKLDDLLFSRERQDFLLLSDGKRSNSEKRLSIKEDGQCENCLMMKWQSNKVKDQLKAALTQVQKLQEEKVKNIESIKCLQKIKDKYLALSTKQDLIIDQIQNIEPSTYQNILLEQAKTIEYMLSSEPITYNSKTDNPRHTISISTHQQKQMNTRIVSSKNHNSNRQSNLVSQFVVFNSEQLGGHAARSSSYFKHKNAVTTINRTDQNSKTKTNKSSTYKVKKDDTFAHRNEIVVSQFNSEANSLDQSDQKSKKQTYMLNRQNSMKRASFNSNHSRPKGKMNYNSKDMNMRRQTSQKTENDILLLTQQSASKKYTENLTPPPTKDNFKHDEMLKLIDQKLDLHNEQDQHKYKSSGDKFGGIIQLKGRPSFASKIQSRGQSDNQRNKQNINPQKLKRAKTNEAINQLYTNKYHQHGYNPMKSNEAESYRRYMQYHLRNNIIEILSKKSGSSLNELNNKDKRYPYMTKSQKLIKKRPESVLQSKQTERSSYREVNKTVR